MAPDLNSLPPSRSSTTASPLQSRSMQSSQSSSNRQNTPSPRASMSLAATASINAADRSRRSSSSYQARGSPQLGRLSLERRRSQVTNNFNLNDSGLATMGELSGLDHRPSPSNSFSTTSPPSLAGIGTVTTGDPHHQRHPSLGDIHNELEQEQEAQVNRMLQMIRAQQHQLEALQQAQQESGHAATGNQDALSTSTTMAVVDEGTPVSERSFSLTRPTHVSRHTSGTARSPATRPIVGHDVHGSSLEYFPPSPLDATRRNSIRDESAFYQAETSSLTRENQMLRLRIRELEKQLSELTANSADIIASSDRAADLLTNVSTSRAQVGK